MSGLQGDALARAGFERVRWLEAGLPTVVWTLDLEVETQRMVSAAELAVLRLVDDGISAIPELARLLGMANDGRLAERVLVKLLAAGAVEVQGEALVVTTVGRRWVAEGSALVRERVTFEVNHDPLRDALQWFEREQPLFADSSTWTVELPRVDDARLLERRPELGSLIRDEGLPDEEDRGPSHARSKVELCSLSIAARRLHWRGAQIAAWRHPLTGEERLVGHISNAEHPPLTAVLAGMRLEVSRQRVLQP